MTFLTVPESQKC